MKKTVFFGALFLSVAAPAAAQSSRQSGSEESAEPNQTVCRSVADTGSRVSRSRVCMTRAQWDERRREARGNIDRSQINSHNEESR